MTSVMIALLLTVWTLAVQASTGGMSYNEATFLDIYSGYFDNLAQYQADNTSHDYITYRTVPVITPAFPGKTVLFGDWTVNVVVDIRELSVPSEGRNGLIYLDVYNITDPTWDKSLPYNLEKLSTLKPEYVQRPSTCRAEFELAGPAMYVGSWPSCKYRINGKPVLYTELQTCNTHVTFTPPSTPEEFSPEPYNFERKGDRFKIPGAPDGFVSPCK